MRPTDETVRETCACGATFDYTGAYPHRALRDWRSDHRHEFPPQAMEITGEMVELTAERDAALAQMADVQGAHRMSSDALDRFRDVVCEATAHDDSNPGDDVLIADLRASAWQARSRAA